MSFHSVLVLGGSGFIGGHVVAKLAETDWRVVVVTRHYEHAKHLLEVPTVEDVIEADIHHDETLRSLLRGQNAIINLVGILHSHPGTPYGPEFAKAHVELPRRIVAAAAKMGVHRYLHMSALGARLDAPSMYLRSKAAGEGAAFAEPSVATTAFRPSVVFGEGDHFLNMFAKLEKFLPVVPLARPGAKFQPVFVEDVARAFVNALLDPRTIGRVYELAGPNVYTLRELVRMAGVYSGHPRPVIGLPDAFARMQAMVLEHLPGEPLMTRDNLDSMSVDNVAMAPIAPELGIVPTPLEAIAPYYLSGNPVAGKSAHSGANAANRYPPH